MKFLIDMFSVKNCIVCAVAMSKKQPHYIEVTAKKFKIKHFRTMTRKFHNDSVIVLTVMQ
jgi:hypothetical protein